MKRKRSEHPRPSDDEAVEATAAAWLAQQDDGLSPAEEAEFARWRGADGRHETAVRRLEGAWSALQQLRDFRPEAQKHPDRDLLRAATRRRARVVSFPAMASAAVAASLILAAAWWFVGTSRDTYPAARHYATTVDGYQRVSLEDGSTLELNGNSEMNVHYLPTARRVRLIRGEAHFTVAKDPLRPFSVEAGNIAVRALGTAFNVRMAASEVEVLVTEGKVDVDQTARRALESQQSRREPENGGKLDEASRAPTTSNPTRLGVNERAIIPLGPPARRAPDEAFATAMPVVERVAPEMIREALAWQSSRLLFIDTPLGEAVAQFNRRNQVQLVIGDSELAALPIGGRFRADNFEGFVRLLEAGGDIVVARPDPNRIVLYKASTLRAVD